MKIVECVPNFSEGRDKDKIRAITREIESVPGLKLLDVDPGETTNRTVVTFIGGPEAVQEAAFRAIRMAAEVIDMRGHKGAHSRIGATDVCPFIPVSGVSMADCIALARGLGQRVAAELGIPVYFYEEAALKPERRNLAAIRQGEYEGLADKFKDPEWAPDCGEPVFNAKSGATVIGAREFLIAYNINLNTPDVAIAKRIAKTIRFSSGGLPCVKAMGVMLESRNLAQVSMNLTDFEQTPVHLVFDAVCREAERHGVSVAGSEIIGLIPRKAVELSSSCFERSKDFRPDLVLENRMASVGPELGAEAPPRRVRKCDAPE
jgi:glutamate formiminotransferase